VSKKKSENEYLLSELTNCEMLQSGQIPFGPGVIKVPIIVELEHQISGLFLPQLLQTQSHKLALFGSTNTTREYFLSHPATQHQAFLDAQRI
jgi:hypothetical protein